MWHVIENVMWCHNFPGYNKNFEKKDVITDYAPLLTHYVAHNEKCPETSHDDDVCAALLCDYEYE